MIIELSERSKQIFRQIVDTYVETGEPIGSRTIARRPDQRLSPASIRNVMADLEDAGLLFAPHTSAGRVPTDLGFRLYVDGLLESGQPQRGGSGADRQPRRWFRSQPGDGAGDASSALSSLSRYAGLVLAPKTERPFKQVELVPLGPGRALVVVVADNGMVENRFIDVPVGIGASALVEAGNHLDRAPGRAFVRGPPADRTRDRRAQERARHAREQGGRSRAGGLGQRSGLRRGCASCAVTPSCSRTSPTCGSRAHPRLFDLLETKKNLLRLIELMQGAQGVQIFIAENELFGMTGCSMVVAPYQTGDEERPKGGKIVGAIGVIGPTRMNYARIIPMVDYTARVISASSAVQKRAESMTAPETPTHSTSRTNPTRTRRRRTPPARSSRPPRPARSRRPRRRARCARPSSRLELQDTKERLLRALAETENRAAAPCAIWKRRTNTRSATSRASSWRSPTSQSRPGRGAAARARRSIRQEPGRRHRAHGEGAVDGVRAVRSPR